MLLINDVASSVPCRQEAFERYAKRRMDGQVVSAPESLPPEQRRLHVRATLREDHEFRIRNRPEGAQVKFDKLSRSPFDFFRGTALLYYRDLAGTDSDLPVVLAVGDVHPENFGVMPNENGAPFFGLDDFDEACFAPFSWDVKRGAVGFWLVARQNGLKKRQRRKIVKSFVRGYLDGLLEFARDDREKWHQLRLDNSPPMIRELLESALASREEFLGDLIDLEKGAFVPSDEIVPHSRHVPRFQKVVDRYVKENEIPVDTRAGHFSVKDVAVKRGSGTASLGLDRYFVLIDGPGDEHLDDVVLEMKQARRSALSGLAPGEPVGPEGAAHQIVQSHDIHLVGGDAYYGRARIDDLEFSVRERSPFKSDIDVDDLDVSGLKQYARICGMTLAQAHARSDEDAGEEDAGEERAGGSEAGGDQRTGDGRDARGGDVTPRNRKRRMMDGQAEVEILASVQEHLFVDDVIRFAEVTARRVRADHELFVEDHAAGAFRFVRSASN